MLNPEQLLLWCRAMILVVEERQLFTFRWKFLQRSLLRLQELIEAIVSNFEDKSPINDTIPGF